MYGGGVIYNLIKYYYNFIDFSYQHVSDRLIIKYNNKIYYLFLVDDFKQVLDQYNLSNRTNFNINNNLFYKFIFNRNNSIFSKINESYYVLLEDNQLLKFNCAYFFNLHLDHYIDVNWKSYWVSRFQYIDSHFYDYVNFSPVISESLDYYLGLLNISIDYISEISYYQNFSAFVSYKNYEYMNELSNPLNLKVDIQERTIGEYLKYLFFSGKYKEVDVFSFLISYKNSCNYNFIIARLLYPNYYFDLLDKVIFNIESVDRLNDYINRVSEFERYIKKIISYIDEFCEIKKISIF